MDTHLTPESLIKTENVVPVASLTGAGTSTAIDMKGATSLRAVIMLGATGTGITFSAALQDSADNSSFAAVVDDAGNAITFAKAASLGATQQLARIRASRLRRYVKLVPTTAGGAAIVGINLEAWGIKDTAHADGASAYTKLV